MKLRWQPMWISMATQIGSQQTKGDLVAERDKKTSSDASDPSLALACVEGNHWEKRRAKLAGRKSRISVDQLMVPKHVFTLFNKPICPFRGHLDDVLDLSWSESQDFATPAAKYQACLTMNGKYLIWQARIPVFTSGDMMVSKCRPSRSKGFVTVTQSYENLARRKVANDGEISLEKDRRCSCNGAVQVQSWPAWGMVIVTAGRGGQIKTFQNFGFEVLI